jgi:H+/Cl- antiporter ClcA
VGGVLGGAFSRLLIVSLAGKTTHGIRRIATARPVVFEMACGLGVALCGLAGHHSSYGTGYAEARGILHGQSDLTLLFMPLKFAATVFSSISGIPGGIFAPSLSIGAGLGAEFHALFQSLGIFESVPIGALALIGMAAYLAGVVQTPITSFVIVSEMTQDHAMVIPLMVTALIADAVSRLICKDGLYHTLSRAFMPDETAAPSRTDTQSETT